MEMRKSVSFWERPPCFECTLLLELPLPPAVSCLSLCLLRKC